MSCSSDRLLTKFIHFLVLWSIRKIVVGVVISVGHWACRIVCCMPDPWYEGLGTTTKERQDKYREWIQTQSGEGQWDGIRHARQRGRLIGREAFQKQVQAMTGRRLEVKRAADLRRWRGCRSKKLSDPVFARSAASTAHSTSCSRRRRIGDLVWPGLGDHRGKAR